MTRTPLRPLARILTARAQGTNPDTVERENLRLRHEEMRDHSRQRAEGRLLILGVFFIAAFAVVGIRMSILANSEPIEPRAAVAGNSIVASRADIVDRNGRILATNLATHSLYAQPQIMVDPEGAAEKLLKIFPDLNLERLKRQFTGERKFVWIRRKLSPEQKQAVHDIGEPGLLFGPREMRLYPNGRLAAHVLGGASFGREGVHSAELIGVAGVERALDSELRDPTRAGQPLALSIDMTVQAATRRVLSAGMGMMNAKGATSVMMDIKTGEIISLVSLPDFDPNDRPAPPTTGNPSDSPLFNRAVQGLYELGSTFKIFTVAQALDLGLVNPSTMIDTTGPMEKSGHKINDFRDYGPSLSVSEVVIKSSNVGTARIALEIGIDRQRDFLNRLGFFDATSVELIEAPGAKPLTQRNWSEITTMTVSYGHGLSASPLHLATAYASLLNGGTRVEPTLLKREVQSEGPRIIRPETSAMARQMLRGVVAHPHGTAKMGEVAGYAVGGKTGTADKPRERGGGYYEDKVIATFASVFPAHDPQYVLIVTLDEPVELTGPQPRRTAGWTAVPVAAEIIRRTAPLLGLRPDHAAGETAALTLTRN